MKVAVVGSRSLTNITVDRYIPEEADEIVSGGALGVDSAAGEFAKKKGIKLTEFLPKYELYGRAAPILRNREIVNYSDKIIVFWDGSSKGALSVIRYAEKIKKPLEVVLCE